jgi:hypothetical protein
MVDWRPILHPQTGRPLLNENGVPKIYDADKYPNGPPAGCCCGGECCDVTQMGDELDLAITGLGGCTCYTRDVKTYRTTAGANEAWRFSTGAIAMDECGGLDRAVDLWCQLQTVNHPFGWTLEAGKTYAIFYGGGGCHATDPVDPLSPDRWRPVEVNIITCNPFHAFVNIPLSDYSPFDFDCNCDGSVDLEFTAPV